MERVEQPLAVPGGTASPDSGRRSRPHPGPDLLAARPPALHPAPPRGGRAHHPGDPDRGRDHRAEHDRQRVRRRQSLQDRRGRTWTAPLGYDEIGLNIAVRLAKGLQTSLMIGSAAVLIIVGIGVTVGAIAGYSGAGSTTC